MIKNKLNSNQINHSRLCVGPISKYERKRYSSSIRTLLFVQDDVKKIINDLSGGEKARLQLALLMLQRDNVLILDEPTNHLDIDSKEMLEQALEHFAGTIIFVSHDRYFINQLANKVFDLDHDGGKMYLGDYQYYIEKTEEAAALKAKAESEIESTNNPSTKQRSTSSYENQKQRRREQRKIEREIEQREAIIESCEAKIEDIDYQLTQPDVYSDPIKSNELAELKSNTEQELEQAMMEWEELQEKL